MGLFFNLKQQWNNLLNDEKKKRKLADIIFDTDTHFGKIFDITLISCILLSVVLVMIESVLFGMQEAQANVPLEELVLSEPQDSFDWIAHLFLPFIHVLEWFFTIFFTIEYLLRVYCAVNRREYVLSFFGVIDFLSTFPAYLAVFFPALHGLLVMRMFRVIRVFRVFKLFDYMNEGHLLLVSLKEGIQKIVVFFLFIVVLVVSIGTVMYMVEHGQDNPNFTSIPNSIYWATVTMTTVGYGDIAPVTSMGRFLASIVMLIGYTVIAVPTGIFTVSMVDVHKKKNEIFCPRCGKSIDKNSHYCKHCGFDVEKDNIEKRQAHVSGIVPPASKESELE
ncbi:MAG: ion transporter [Paludibacteraceae bacterium]|nr:ion transporter [Paludibacteraceae bacterium]